ncbi:MAG: helix-turn-helix transcriptional regulator [Acidobacteriota bacterium]|nr:helix-turn-helix transcriptional regulator [Acidobacteriota bacterium]
MSEPAALFQGDAFNANCPTRVVLDQIADKWTVLVLGALHAGPVRFNALRRRLGGISQKMLGQTLKQLERNGLVERRAFATVPVTVEYSVTPLGAALTRPVNALREWAESNIHQMLAAQQRYDAARSESPWEETHALKSEEFASAPRGNSKV